MQWICSQDGKSHQNMVNGERSDCIMIQRAILVLLLESVLLQSLPLLIYLLFHMFRHCHYPAPFRVLGNGCKSFIVPAGTYM